MSEFTSKARTDHKQVDQVSSSQRGVPTQAGDADRTPDKQTPGATETNRSQAKRSTQRTASAPSTFSKVTTQHLRRDAVLYVRQSTSQQLRDHQESTQRQYQLVHRLESLGWQPDQINVIDDDLGISGSGRTERPGFRRLLRLVTEQKVGIVLGLEMSRLARNSKDWHDLFEVCAVYEVLIADEDGTFDTNDPNDRLVLGLKGIISEMELHTMKVRLERGRLNKAKRGELFHDVPVGYVKNEAGLPEFDPDESARRTMQQFFDLFETVGSASGLFKYLNRQNIRLPFRDQTGTINWRLAAKTTVYALLKHPLYAGAFGYGRTKRYGGKRPDERQHKHLPPEQWKVLIKDCCPAYITWSQYEANQKRLQNNNQRRHASGPPRSGSALLSGIVFCECCGRRLSPLYANDGHGSYSCGRHRTLFGVEPCHNSVACAVLDQLISDKLLEALQPTSAPLSLQAITDETSRRSNLEQTHVDQVKRTRYEVELTQRRYEQVDPANRLVAATLERNWEEALQKYSAAEQALADFQQSQPVELTNDERHSILQACSDVTKLWHNHADTKDKKELIRLLIDRIVVQVHNNTERVSVAITWSGGFESRHQIIRTVMNYRQLEDYDRLLARALELTLSGLRSPRVAEILYEEGFRTPRRQQRISADMVKSLLGEERSHQQLHSPVLSIGQWRADRLAEELSIPLKRLKDWVTRGWAIAAQRPFGRTWVIWADATELGRLHKLAIRQTDQGTSPPPIELRTPTQRPRK